MKQATWPARGDVRLAIYVALGTLAGAAYVVFDMLSESRLESGTLTGALAGAPAVIDRGLPGLVGGLLRGGPHLFPLRGPAPGPEKKGSPPPGRARGGGKGQ